MSKIGLQDERGFNQVFAPVGSTPFRALRRNSWFATQAERVGAKRILEIGCGTGEAAAHVAASTTAEVVGIDISDAFLQTARANHQAPNLSFEKFDLFNDDPKIFGDFDLIYGNGILHHLVLRLDSVLRILRDMTRPGGGLAFIEPNLMNPYCAFIFGTKIGRKWAHLEPDEMAFKASALGQAIRQAGWQDVNVATRDFLVPGIPVGLIRPIVAVEPFLEGLAPTRWLAQSHFVTARSAQSPERGT
ncbi:class I SAM-dependent methyltransferase [Bradyrhizobium sp. U87765 SZCCT0131]|uniref:class I SAM-dependent methyltransferase n=1 Tax=unclassified Bradyrhizobium TaxID=2631580 RepID=UPI001BA6355F|nr:MULTISPECIES: class I SAM-dependent methyltransferase [unclassified Bradyrhizobium]MBR1216916.1 class I SAM-dependent methyltransferase [Bradyrhizobium sp. U87765 SZCCT0131]MBR1259328.1 class I SAM-dependent methyltransferase [Bradyrhizobium sp. U87765 SZCCT0134]MBR1305469.1 class I SAM-dependent methyltransferase [Bradyrhizobium sp. U87765 SZCCT0110]MBR1321836.1 class I SAM-dependent methyltransferase [Bradyrhizobium sp. U87765 SZCCT0109]MBR1350886.1 class I SAM-dependent methyltransferase